MMRSARELDRPGCRLKQTGPGLYVDESGAEYFYLTGLYPCVAQHLAENHWDNTPAFVVDVLIELRSALRELCHTELVD